MLHRVHSTLLQPHKCAVHDVSGLRWYDKQDKYRKHKEL